MSSRSIGIAACWLARKLFSWPICWVLNDDYTCSLPLCCYFIVICKVRILILSFLLKSALPHTLTCRFNLPLIVSLVQCEPSLMPKLSQYKLYVVQDWPKTIFSKTLQIIVNYIVYLFCCLYYRWRQLHSANVTPVCINGQDLNSVDTRSGVWCLARKSKQWRMKHSLASKQTILLHVACEQAPSWKGLTTAAEPRRNFFLVLSTFPSPHPWLESLFTAFYPPQGSSYVWWTIVTFITKNDFTLIFIHYSLQFM